MSARREGQA